MIASVGIDLKFVFSTLGLDDADIVFKWSSQLNQLYVRCLVKAAGQCGKEDHRSGKRSKYISLHIHSCYLVDWITVNLALMISPASETYVKVKFC